MPRSFCISGGSCPTAVGGDVIELVRAVSVPGGWNGIEPSDGRENDSDGDCDGGDSSEWRWSVCVYVWRIHEKNMVSVLFTHGLTGSKKREK